MAAWQQELASEAWERWVQEHEPTTGALVVNFSGCRFVAPTVGAYYRYQGQSQMVMDPVAAFYGLCVLERIPAPVRFLSYAFNCLRRQGLLFLTFAYWAAEGPDIALGAGGRIRIYDRQSLTKLLSEARRIGFRLFGGTDWTYHGDVLGDHTLASLVLVKR